jgi:hypothetical protein
MEQVTVNWMGTGVSLSLPEQNWADSDTLNSRSFLLSYRKFFKRETKQHDVKKQNPQ